MIFEATTDPVRWLWAGLAVLGWGAILFLTVRGVRRARRTEAERRQSLAVDGDDDGVLVAYASQTGFAEELAWMTARALSDGGVGARVVSFADLDLAALTATRRALFVVSTTGEGDPPDSAARMVRTVLSHDASLPDLSWGLLSLGDRSYRDFCSFGRGVEAWLRASGATPLFDTVEVDDGDAAAIRHWQHQLNALTGATTAPDWTPAAFDRWRLAERRLLNPGSPGGEAWHLALEPVGALPGWSAGDIVEIGVPVPADWPAGTPAPGAREYSIASLPGDGRIELLVRLMTHPDGRPGLASGWLTQIADIGAEVPLRVRVNRGFHAPGADVPMILIGNGTGLAGLRAHLKAREQAGGSGGAWLMFGERTAAHDAFHDAELRGWRANGTLTRLDRVFSRDVGPDGATGRYVQSLIADHAATLRDWVGRGAAIYVCGSLNGMASGVHAALEQALGVDGLILLTESCRYRRDVY